MKKLKKNLFVWILVVLAIFGSIDNSKAQDNTGTEFWFTLFSESFIDHLPGVYIVGYYDATVTIDYVARNPAADPAGDPQCTQYTFNLIGGVPQFVNIPYDLQALCWRYNDDPATPEIITNNGIKITSTAPIAVYSQHFTAASSEMTPILPVTEMGMNYIATAYREITSDANDFNARVSVIATEDATQVTFTLPQNTWTSFGNNGGMKRAPGSTWSVTLNKGQTYTILSNDNGQALTATPTGSTVTVNNNQGLNGVLVTANKVISVMGGTDCTWIGNDEYPGCGACDLSATHFRPTDKWKQKYITTQTLVRPLQTSLAVGLTATPNIEPFPANANQKSVSDYLLITAKDNGTAVNITGAATYTKTLNAGQWFIYESPGNSNPVAVPPYSPGATHHVITANKPIQVIQMMKGWQCDNNNPADPTQMLVMEEPLWRKDYIVTNPTQYVNNFFVFIIKEPTAGTTARATLNLNVAGLNIAIPAGNSPTNDGTGGWTQIGTTGYFFQRVNIGVGGAIKAKSVPNAAGNSFPFAFYASGSTNASSYGYMGGAVCNLIVEAKADPDPTCLGTPVILGLDTTLNGGTVNGTVSYNYSWTVFQGGTQVGNTTGLLSPTVDYSFTGATAGQYMAVLNLTDNAGCSDLDTIYFDVIAPPTVNDLADVVNCGPFQLPNITGANLSGGQKYYSGPGATGTSYNIGQMVSTSGTYYIYDSTATDCFSEQDFLLTINESPVVDPATITRTCDGANIDYVLEFTVSGGTGGPYYVNAIAPAGLTGNFTGNTWTSAPMPSGTTYNLEITDDNGCPAAIVTGVKNCNCTSDAGTMSSTLISICGNDPITAPTGTIASTLDANDVESYILHNGSGGAVGSMLIDSSTTPTFAFNAGTMAYGTTYYISRVVGNDGGSGYVDLNDLCLSVAPGTPVVWYTPTSAAISAISPLCFGTDAEVTFTIAGNGPFTVVYTNGESGQNETINNAGTSETVVFPIDSTATYTLVSVTSNTNGCAALVDPSVDFVTIVVNDVPTYTNLSENCNNTNTEYTVSFDVVNGSAPYTVSIASPMGISGSFIGNTWTSDPIASGVTYDFEISDGNGCGTTQVTGVSTCVCTSSSGGMDLTQKVVCGDGPITTSTNPGQPAYFDGNDTINFILHTSPDNTMGTLLGQSQTPTFSFIPGVMTYSTVYYISAIVGNNDGNGNVDLGDNCLAIAYGTPVIWNELPVAIINSNAPVCAGVPLTLMGSNTTNMTGVNYAWTGPNGFTSGQQNPTIPSPTTLSTGLYTLFVSKTGCSDTAQANIVVNANAVADFTSTLISEITVPHNYQFNNQSQNSNAYMWYFSNEDSSVVTDPSYEFLETEGSVPVTLIALNVNGCHDTITYLVNVQVDYTRDEALVFVPNTFTPDDNEYNQFFAPKFNESVDLQYFKMEIFNRWGEVVYTTEDPTTGWDGTYKQERAVTGVYTWKISFRDKYSYDRYNYEGTVLLLK